MKRSHGVRANLLSILLGIAALFLAVPAETYGQSSPPKQTRALYGINADPVWSFESKDLPQFEEMIKKSGCGAVRVPIRWLVLEPRKGMWDFSAVDRALQSIPDDVEILGTLMSVPQWANGIDPKHAEGWFDAYPPRDLEDWERAVSTIVAHYRSRIRHWEIWNEQNGVDFFRPRPDARAYSALLKTAYQAAKKANPQCLVVLGGLQMNGIIANPWSEVKTTNFLEDLYATGAQPYFDICNIHPYVLPEEGATRMIALTQDTLAVMARHGDVSKPLWITEVGCGAASPEAERAQAQLLRDTFQQAAAETRIEKVFWFMLRDLEKDLLGPESTMGLFRRDGTPKPALEAFQRR